MTDDWQANAACTGADPAMFFADDATQAKAHCAVCPVSNDCLGYAISRGIRDGVWGGLNGEELARYRRHVQRGRQASAQAVLDNARRQEPIAS